MKVQIIGEGSFGSFLSQALPPCCDLCSSAPSVILAVPLSAYEEVARKNRDKHLINVCSVQKPSMDTCLRHTRNVTGIHPLFGKRTPTDKRNSILTHHSGTPEET